MGEKNNLIIIGGGAAGLAAALYAARFRLKTLIIAKEFGGTGNIAHRVDNWIGEPGISGFDLMQKFIAHVKSYEVPFVDGEVGSVAKTENEFRVMMRNGTSYDTSLLLFSNGMVHRKLGVPGEEEYSGRGVHYCYTCDGPLYKNKVLAVAGGSDSAALGTIFLSEYASKVYTIFRRALMTAEPVSVEKVHTLLKVELIPSSNITTINGADGKVTKLVLDSGRELMVDGLFVEVGHLPLNELAKQLGVAVDERGYIMVNRRQETNIPGVFAAGDITNATELKQFITSASEGSIAAQTAYNTINTLHGGYR